MRSNTPCGSATRASWWSRAGFDTEFTQRNTTFMTSNLLHLARLPKDAGGIPAHGDQRSAWEAERRFDHPNPEDR